MTYPEFKTAADRHLMTCYKLIDTVGEDDPEILLNIYYLSGYVAECSLKYVNFAVKGFPIGDNVDEVNTTYSYIPKKELNHNLGGYISSINNQNSSIFDNVRECLESKLFKEWKPQIRYSESYLVNPCDLSKQSILNHLEKIRIFSHTLISQYAPNN